jgi:hypothetical protein
VAGGRKPARRQPARHAAKAVATTTPELSALQREVRQAAKPGRIPAARRALKVEHGGYGEGDTVIGVSVPDARAIARRYAGMQVGSIVRLLRSTIHEERLVALLMLVRRYENGDEALQERILPELPPKHRARE